MLISNLKAQFLKKKYHECIILIVLIILIVDLISPFENLGSSKAIGQTKSTLTNPDTLFEVAPCNSMNMKGLLQIGGNKKQRHDCNRLKKQINKLISQANFCTVDSDCILADSSNCLFSCYSLINKSSDTSKIKKEIKKYSVKLCAVCNIACIAPPQQENIKCKINKCTDNRFEN